MPLLRRGDAEAGDPALEAGIGPGRAGRQQQASARLAAAASAQHALSELANEHQFLHAIDHERAFIAERG